MSYYCAVDTIGEIVWGIGFSCKEALRDAEEHIESWNRRASLDEEVDFDDLECFPCTKQIRDAVCENGGDVSFRIRDANDGKFVDL